MLPLLALGFFTFACVGVGVGTGVLYLCSGPTKQNESVNKVEENLESEENRARKEAESKKAAEMLEKERKSIEERERELEHTTSILALEKDKFRAEVDSRMEEEKGRRKTEDEARKRLEEDRQKLAGRIRNLEKREKEQNEAIEKQKKENAARLEAEKKFGGPLRWPTREEYQETLSRTKYDKSHFHFGIAGRAGSGKSSLINAFRNLGNKDEGAARTGTKETTLETARYPDPGTEPPRKWMVWFDVPGAGTKRIPHKDYFVKQGLYVLDLLILAIGDRFEEIDARIIEDCARFKVPVFIVRSKADMHILNMMKEHNGHCARITDDPALYQTCRDEFVNESQETVSEELVGQDLPDQAVYVVSRDVLRRTYNEALHRQGTITDGGQEEEVGAIHECHLIKEILAAAVKRRCDTGGWSATKNALGMVADSLGGVFSGDNNVDEVAPSNPRAASGQTGGARPTTPAVLENPREKALRVIYPRAPTDGNELFSEMIRNDPELWNILAEKPRMLTPTVAVLTFYPLALIPREIRAFGGVLHLKDYEKRKKRRQ